MAEDKNQFTSIYGDAEDEFEIEDVSDETLTIPTDEIRAAREEEIAAEAEDADVVSDAQDAAETAPRDDDTDAEISDEALAGGESAPDGDIEPYSDDEMEGITFGDTGIVSHRETVHYDAEPDDDSAGRVPAHDDDPAAEEQEDDPDKVSLLSYLGHAILFTIPVIGTILMLVYIISDKKNPHLRHLAQAWLVTLLIVAVGLVVAAYMFGIA